MSLDVAHDRFFTEEELYRFLKISRSSFSKAKKDGQIPKSITMMGRVLYPSSEINKFIKDQNPELWVEDNQSLSASLLSAATDGKS